MFCGEFFPVLYCRSYPHVQRLTFHLQSLSVFYPFSCINLGFISTLAILHVSACFSWTLGQFISVLCISSFPVPAPRSYCVSALLSVASGLPFVTLDFGLRTSLTLNKAFCSFTFLGRLKKKSNTLSNTTYANYGFYFGQSLTSRLRPHHNLICFYRDTGEWQVLGWYTVASGAWHMCLTVQLKLSTWTSSQVSLHLWNSHGLGWTNYGLSCHLMLLTQ